MNIRSFRPNKWWYWILGILLVTSGLTTSSLTFLVQLPQFNCQSESESINTASARVYCASTMVDERNPEKLLEAIKLVNVIPPTNPLRSNSDKLLTRWSQAMIQLSEESFQKGDLRQAIDLAKQLPDNISINQQIPTKIKEWQSVWSEAEDIYKAAEATMNADEAKNWYVAITKAKELKSIKNEYWATTKYQELIYSIQAIKEKRERSADSEKSPDKVADKNSTGKNLVATEQEKEDLSQLKKARTLASSGKTNDMRNALMEASLVISDAHYQDARMFIQTLEIQIAHNEDNSYLEEAKKLAEKKDSFSLEMAINEASLIGKERPLYQQASQHIKLWKKQKEQEEKSLKSQLKSSVSENSNNKKNQPLTTDVFSPASENSHQEVNANGFKLEKLEDQVIQKEQN
jgi:hypothetical protein